MSSQLDITTSSFHRVHVRYAGSFMFAVVGRLPPTSDCQRAEQYGQ